MIVMMMVDWDDDQYCHQHPHQMVIVVRSGLTELEKKFPALLSRARGRGTFCAVDLPDVAAR